MAGHFQKKLCVNYALILQKILKFQRGLKLYVLNKNYLNRSHTNIVKCYERLSF